MGNPDGQQLPSLVDRAKRLLLSPREEWRAIASEEMTIGNIFRNWVLILAAIGPVALLVGSLIFGHSLFGVTYRPPVGTAIATAVASYLAAIAGTYIAALIFNWLAPNFKGTADMLAATKLAAFSFTAAWIAGIFQILPTISWLGILGIYSFYLLYLGGPVLMKIPGDKAMPFTIVSVLVSAVLFLIVGAVTSGVTKNLAPRSSSSLSGKLSVPGVGAIDLSALEETGRQIENMGKSTASGKTVQALPAETLKALLPDRLGQWRRTEISSSSAGVAGLGGSQAEARYTQDEQSFRLQVTDIAVAGGFAAMAGALDISSSKESEDGYEKTGKVDGRLTTEEWNTRNSRGKYSVMVANRFMVEAEGQAPDIEVLKQAARSVDFEQLEKLARASS